MAKPNYQFEKRKKDLEKKAKKEEKRLRKLDKGGARTGGDDESAQTEQEPAGEA